MNRDNKVFNKDSVKLSPVLQKTQNSRHFTPLVNAALGIQETSW